MEPKDQSSKANSSSLKTQHCAQCEEWARKFLDMQETAAIYFDQVRERTEGELQERCRADSLEAQNRMYRKAGQQLEAAFSSIDHLLQDKPDEWISDFDLTYDESKVVARVEAAVKQNNELVALLRRALPAIEGRLFEREECPVAQDIRTALLAHEERTR